MNETLQAWNLQLIELQTNKFIGCQRPTTQEDNFGEIADIIDLYHVPDKLFNGTLADMRDGKIEKVGRLVKYVNGDLIVWHGRIKYKI